MVHVKLTKKMKKMVDGKEVTVDRVCSAEESQVPLMEKSGWSVAGKKIAAEDESSKQTTPKQTGPKVAS